MFPSHSQSANVLDLRELVEGSFASQNSSDFEYSVPLSTQSASSHEALSPISPPQKEIGSSQRTMSLREPRPKHRQFRLPMRQITLAKKKFDKMKSDPNQSTEHLSEAIREIEGTLHRCKSQIDGLEYSAQHQRQPIDPPTPLPSEKKKCVNPNNSKKPSPAKKRKRPVLSPSPEPAPVFETPPPKKRPPTMDPPTPKIRKKSPSPPLPTSCDARDCQQQIKQLSKDITEVRDQVRELSNLCENRLFSELAEIRKCLSRNYCQPVPLYMPWDYCIPRDQQKPMRPFGSVSVIGVGTGTEKLSFADEEILFGD